MDTDSFLAYIKTDEIYMDSTVDIKKKGSILKIINQKEHWLEENLKKVIGFTKNELGGKIMKEVVGL